MPRKITWDILNGTIGNENIEIIEKRFLEWQEDQTILYRWVIQWDDSLFGFDVTYDLTRAPIDTTDLFKVGRNQKMIIEYEKVD